MKKNCKDTKTFMDEFYRMCYLYNDDICDGCPMIKEGITEDYEGRGYNCELHLFDNPEKAIDIVQRWSDEHQPERVIDHINSLLPNCDFNLHDVCCCWLDSTLKPYTEDGLCAGCCDECWNRPYEEAKGELICQIG